MLFHSVEFMFGFLPIVFVAFVAIAKIWGHRASLAWLTIASLAVYAQWSLLHGALLFGSLLMNFVFCQLIIGAHRAERAGAAKSAFIAAIAANLLILGYLKYSNFFIDNLNLATGAGFSYVEVLLPVGVSFFTFIQIGFVLEVYNRQVEDVSILDYFLFGSFFAYITAGPLVLQRDMLPQFADHDRRILDPSRIAVAIAVFGFGLFKKLVLADGIAPIADAVFNGTMDGALPSMSLAWIGALAYTLQLYFDFSGYSDMALGIGLLFGLKLPFNFNSPLKATSITDFWRRWHMTMTRFFTNYLYAPLAIGNSRRAIMHKYGPVKRFLATVAWPVFFTFLLAGIWHGAGWTFLVFGAIHGVAMAANHAWRQAKMPELPDALGWLCTMLVVVAGLVVFRAPDLGTAGTILTAMVDPQGLGVQWLLSGEAGEVNYADAVALLTILLAVALMLPNTQQVMYHHNISSDPADYEDVQLTKWLQWRPSLGWAVKCGLVLVCALGLATGDTAFIYYQF